MNNTNTLIMIIVVVGLIALTMIVMYVAGAF